MNRIVILLAEVGRQDFKKMTLCQRQLWICLVHEFEFSADFNVLQQRK